MVDRPDDRVPEDLEGSAGDPDRVSGDQDRVSGDQGRVSGDQDSVSGDQDRVAGGGPPPPPRTPQYQERPATGAPVRSVDIGLVITTSLRTMFRNFGAVLGTGVIFYSPFMVLAVYAAGLEDDELKAKIELANILVSSISATLAGCVFVHFTYRRLQGESATISGSFGPGLSRFFPVILANVLVTIALLVGLLLLIVPGVFVAVITCVVLPACVVDRLGPIAAIERSAELTKGSRWVILALGIIIMFAQTVVAIPTGIGQAFASGTAAYGLAFVGSLLAVGLGIFTAIGVTVLYHELRRAHGDHSDVSLEAVFE